MMITVLSCRRGKWIDLKERRGKYTYITNAYFKIYGTKLKQNVYVPKFLFSSNIKFHNFIELIIRKTFIEIYENISRTYYQYSISRNFKYANQRFQPILSSSFWVLHNKKIIRISTTCVDTIKNKFNIRNSKITSV